MTRAGRIIRRNLFACGMLVLLTAVTAGCFSSRSGPFGFKPRLAFSEPPVLGKTVEITLSFGSPPEAFFRGPYERYYYNARIILTPLSYSLVEGDLTATDILKAGEEHVMTAKVQATREGVDIIYGAVAPALSPGGSGGGDYDMLYVAIRKDAAFVTRSRTAMEWWWFWTDRGHQAVAAGVGLAALLTAAAILLVKKRGERKSLTSNKLRRLRVFNYQQRCPAAVATWERHERTQNEYDRQWNGFKIWLFSFFNIELIFAD